MRLFTVNKVPVSLESVTHESELRRGENRVKIAVLHCKVLLSRKHAAAMPDGVLRRLYAQSGEDVDPMTLRHDFPALCDRQILTIAESADSAETRALDQVRVYGVHAKRTTTENVFTLRFNASFGPLSKDEWQFVEHWRTTLRHVTFKPAQASIEYEIQQPDESTDDAADEAERAKSPALPLEGACTHGARVGEVCEDCPDQVAAAVEHARVVPMRNPKGKRGNSRTTTH